MANLWPKTVIALTLAGIDPEPVSVLGLTDEGYYTFEMVYREDQTVVSKPVRVATQMVMDAEGVPIRRWNQWPSESVARDVMEAYMADLEVNVRNRLDERDKGPVS